ncbi:MAG: hypothetical protein CO135_03360 [Candidatus Levybacteria bacterium CG_4_9_14_3_um_filter_35_16]|nr:MAG: hypothetical protein COW87_03460 [Candidatus Levybacteria bacterium CG22_combo_CG10-13_8_21_14_all_35_11]PIY95143.1 MAG: hypothetical protein COY68_00175 [Candidatus Levybacteria bacterium CG_4_10_14_0_8_um_filter_35_23]PIZ99090.1 MAG: hypothetical protein COX78_02290 [Candidatus Levybacteria bacterium CG_4_10_14_0_2_um_filter_35_8]PJA91016.1 MAG: hypothetical protein CO135_03360 [Candidatus Levybacteria bacterium CG_4_9_14_3_um_filter_35_16]PJC54747.1 MAG: hypothetical protein CO028_00
MKNLMFFYIELGLITLVLLTITYNFIYRNGADRAGKDLEIPLSFVIKKLLTFNIFFSVFSFLLIIILFIFFAR